MTVENSVRTISATQARVHFGDVLKRVFVNHEQVIVEKDGLPVAVIMSVPHYQQLLRELKLARFERSSREAGLDAERAGPNEEQLEREMEEIRRRSHGEAYG